MNAEVDEARKKKKGKREKKHGNGEEVEGRRKEKDKDKESRKREKKRKRVSEGGSGGGGDATPAGKGQNKETDMDDVADKVHHNGDPIAVSKQKRKKKQRVEPPSHNENLPTTKSATTSTGATITTDSSPLSLPFTQTTALLYLPLSPVYSPHPFYSLESDHLDPLILTYYSPLKGIILAYRNIRFKQSGAVMQADSPFAFTWVQVDFLVWSPKKGDIVEGWVNLQSESHVGLLVLNTFNVSVPRGKIPAGWRWCETREGFISKAEKRENHMKKAVEEIRQTEDKSIGEDEEGAEEEENAHVEEEEEDLGGWMDENGNYVDGMLRVKVASVRASGHIIAIEGDLLLNGGRDCFSGL